MAKSNGGASSVHKTQVSKAAWDGPANESRVIADGTRSYFTSIYAWQRDGEGAIQKSDYRVLHHEIGDDGSAGPANVSACRKAINMLNGMRGTAAIPNGDRQGVYNHLAAHMRDAGVEPPELRKLGPRAASQSSVEKRSYSFELRKLTLPESDTPPALEGYAAVFNVETVLVPRGAFYNGSPEIREVIEPGAFRKTLRETDQRAVWNHNTDIVLGRRSNNTLNLREDETGLAVEILPPSTPLVRDMVLAPIERGDVGQMSFMFWSLNDEIEEVDEDTILIRQKEVSLMEVSPVAIPAYSETTISARSFERMEEFCQQRIADVQEENATADSLKSDTGEASPEPIIDHSDSTAEAEPVPDHLSVERTLRAQLEYEILRAEQ